MSWVSVAIAGSAVVGAAGSAYAANSAANASRAGTNRALDEQGRQFNIGMQLYEPQRRLGYQAMSDIAALYGYGMPGYQPASQLLYGSAGGGPTSVGGDRSSSVGPVRNAMRAGTFGIGGAHAIFGGDDNRKFGGEINPETGTVDVRGRNPERDALMTEYLRTGTWGGAGRGRRYSRLLEAADALRNSGWSWDAEGNRGAWEGEIEPTEPVPPGSTGSQSILDRISSMPGYQFGLREGEQAIQRSAAARTGGLGGNTLRAINTFGQDYAGTKFNEEFNRLLAMAGMGQTATTGSAGLSQNYGANAANLLQQQGDARASGILGAWNGANNTLNNGLNTWLMYRGGYFNPPGGSSGYTLPSDLQGFDYLDMNNPNLYRLGS